VEPVTAGAAGKRVGPEAAVEAVTTRAARPFEGRARGLERRRQAGDLVRQVVDRRDAGQAPDRAEADPLQERRTCSACGSVKIKLALSERVFICDACRHVADRDINAALNLAALAATEARSQGRTDVTIATPATALVARGATDLDKRRSRRLSQATAVNRTGPLAGPPPENRRAA